MLIQRSLHSAVDEKSACFSRNDDQLYDDSNKNPDFFTKPGFLALFLVSYD